MAGRNRVRIGVWLAWGVCVCSHPVAAAESWGDPEAEVRFTLQLTGRPTHASAGYFAHLPDGGILPGPHPVTKVVVRGKGSKEIESHTLWHSAEGGVFMVFADPGRGVEKVDVYVRGGRRARTWSAESGLTPSALLCVEPGRADLAVSRRLGRLGKVGATVHARNKAGVKRAPFSIGGDDSGRPRPASFYLLAHVVVSDPGKTWIAPFVLDGECEVRVDGRRLDPEKRIDKWGGTGDYFNLERGLHRVEVFQTAGGSGPYSSHGRKGGLMYLTWRTPNATMKELGGVRSKKAPMPGTSRMETRVLRENEIARSGSCRVEGAVTRGGGPAACVGARSTHVFWFGDEAPLLVYELEALRAGHPSGTRYRWALPGGATVEGSTVRWLFPGFRENGVKLTASSGGRSTQCAHRFYGFCTARTSLDNAAHREAFREALTTMVEACPVDPDAAASWGPSLWNNLIRTAELGEGYALLRNLFAKRLDSMREKLSPAQAAALRDIYLDMLERRQPREALQMIDKLMASFDPGAGRDSLLIRKAEIYMYQLSDYEAAGRGLGVFSERKGELAEWARIRLGDLAFLQGDLNRATELYAEVQARARRQRNQAGGLIIEELLSGGGEDGGKAGEPEAPEKRIGDPRPLGGKREKPPPEGAPESGTGEILPYRRESGWRAGALRDVSNSENIAKLIREGYLLEAREAMRAWEREFPLSKIGGDLLLVEARYRMKLEDWKRARVMLEAYCREVDASSFLPDAARLLIECAAKMKSPRDEIRAVIEKVKKRLEYHPVAKELEEFLTGKE